MAQTVKPNHAAASFKGKSRGLLIPCDVLFKVIPVRFAMVCLNCVCSKWLLFRFKSYCKRLLCFRLPASCILSVIISFVNSINATLLQLLDLTPRPQKKNYFQGQRKRKTEVGSPIPPPLSSMTPGDFSKSGEGNKRFINALIFA